MNEKYAFEESRELDPRHRKAINYYLLGCTKKDAAKKAGFAANSARDIFARPDVIREIERRVRVSEKKADMDRDYLLGKLKEIIEASPGDLIEFDSKGRPSLNWSNMSNDLRKAISKVTIDSSRPGGKYKQTKTHVSISVPDKINAIKEAATLLGLREEKTKIEADQTLIDILASRRRELVEGPKEETEE